MTRYLERAEHTARLVDVAVDLRLGRSSSDASAIAAVRPRPAGGCPADIGLVDRSRVLRQRQSQFGHRVRRRRARERAAGPRRDQLRRCGSSSTRCSCACGRCATIRRAPRAPMTPLEPSSKARISLPASRTRRWGTGKGGITCRRGASWSGRWRRPGCSTPSSATNQVRCAMPPLDRADWVALLRSCAALEGYCRQYTADVRPERVTEFLLLNAECPRSVRFAAARVEDALPGAGAAQRPRDRRPGRAARRPAARVARLRPGRRGAQRRSARLPRGARRASAAQLNAALYQSYIILRRGIGAARLNAIHRPPRHAVHLRHAHHRERDGGAHAAAQRRAAALPALFADGGAGGARDDVPGPRRQHRPLLQHPGAARAADADRRRAGRVPARRSRCRTASGRARGRSSTRWRRRASGGNGPRRARSRAPRRGSTRSPASCRSSGATIRSSCCAA